MGLSANEISFCQEVKGLLIDGHRTGNAPFKSKTQYEKLAISYGITDKNNAKELAEFSTLLAAREIVKEGQGIKQTFNDLVKLYDIQPGLTHRTSWSTIYQQYSTPIPIAYLAGIFCQIDKEISVFEPSAGNGLLTVAGKPNQIVVNEIDSFRSQILSEQGFNHQYGLDASKPNNFKSFQEQFDAVLTNPPFDKLDIKERFNGVEWTVLDHLMAAIALSTLKLKGKAAVIIGGHTTYDEKGRIKAGKNRTFLSYLYHHFNVKDVINIDGELYRKQGTQFDIRLILIDGIRDTSTPSYPPLVKEQSKPVSTFEELFDRVTRSMENKDTMKLKLKLRAKAVKAKLQLKGVEKEPQPNEIELVYHRPSGELPVITSSLDAYNVLKNLYSENQKYLKEFFYVLLLDRSNKVLGHYKVSEGSKNATVVDISQIVALAAKANASGVIVSHNHPSTQLKPSEADIKLTRQLKEALMLIEVHLLDHLIIGGHGYFSFVDERAISGLGTANGYTYQISPITIDGFTKVKRKSKWKLQDGYLSHKSKKPFELRENKKYYSIDFNDKMVIIPKSAKRADWEKHGFVFKLERGLSGPYDPVAVSCFSLQVNVPDSMDTEVKKAQQQLHALGDVVEFVRKELQYESREELCDALAAEQIDAVAMAILKAKKNQGMIIGDQTGIGKGRQAAAMIRWGVLQGGDYWILPVFITEKKNLFSDLYRDLAAIGSGHLKPFIVNADGAIKDQDKKVIHKSNPGHQKEVFQYYDSLTEEYVPGDIGEVSSNPLVGHGYDFVITTYSQFFAKKAISKRKFLQLITKSKGIMILDEAHNVSGVSDSGLWFQGIVSKAATAIFLSATYAKRPDNMALYAQKTTLRDIGADPEEFDKIMKKGGMALQEIVASKLAENGEMVRRERPYEDVEVNYLVLTEKSEEHRAKADAITGIIRDIIQFEDQYVMSEISRIDDELAEMQQSTEKSNKSAGVNKMPLFSKVFQTIYQMLMAIKVDDVVERAVMRLKEGNKVVIAFGNTMESFLNEYPDGAEVKNDFSEILNRALEGTLKYTVRDGFKVSHSETIKLEDLGPNAMVEYSRILKKIQTVSSGITISPIDVMIQKLEAAGYRVEEVTGRNRRLEFNKTWSSGTVVKRIKRARENQFFDFQNNECDVLLINQSGSTGASAHAIPTNQVPRNQVKPRTMIVLQPELDINKEIQKRGRVNRTGQIYPPKFDYIVSNIPAETRLLMMLKNKLRSLDANTSGSTSTSKKLLDYDDIMNKYGDLIITQYCSENEEFSRLIGDPLGLFEKREIEEDSEDSDDEESIESEGSGELNRVPEASTKVTGRVAIIPTTRQEEFYNAIFKRYRDYVDSLKESGDYDLDVQLFNLQSETLEKEILKVGSGTGSPFSGNSYLETCEVNNLTPPLQKIEVEGKIQDCLASFLNGFKEPSEYSAALLRELEERQQAKLAKAKQGILEWLNQKKQDANADPKLIELEPSEAKERLEKRLTDIFNTYEQRVTKLENAIQEETQELRRIFQWFSPGKSLDLVTETGELGTILAKSVFLGFKIDLSASNPFAPSNIKMLFAGLEQYRTLTVTLSSFRQKINETIGQNIYRNADYLERWDELRKEASKSRIKAYIITGNVVAALAEEKVPQGTLIRFTDKAGNVRTGFRLKKYDVPSGERNITVPVYMARKYVLDQASRFGANLSKKIDIGLRGGNYFVSVPASRTEGGEIYQDQDLLIEAGGQFEKSGNFMVLRLSSVDTLNRVLKYLQDHHFVTVSVPKNAFSQVEEELPEDIPEVTKLLDEAGISKPEPNTPISNSSIKLKLRLKAKAVALKLKLQA